jgi:universal stress protein A
MNWKKILFATDFSPASEGALHYASALARDANASLLILHVEELPAPYSAGELMLPQPEFPNPELRKMLDAVVPHDKTIHCEHQLVLGVPAEDIVRVADEENADLIVIGTHGRTGLMRVLMGSVAEAVMRKAGCPVLTVKQSSKAAALA